MKIMQTAHTAPLTQLRFSSTERRSDVNPAIVYQVDAESPKRSMLQRIASWFVKLLDRLSFGLLNFSSHKVDEGRYADILKTSGLDEEIQGASDENKRLPFMVNPKPIVITAWVKDKLVGMASGINLGEYGFLATLAVDRALQGSGMGKQLLRMFKDKLESDCGGPTSVATLSGDDMNIDNDSHRFWLRRNFKPLKNALYLKRGQELH